MTGYVDRLSDNEIAVLLESFPAVIVVGPRASGKTTTALHHAARTLRLDRPADATAVRLDPDAVLTGSQPLLLDEWQLVPEVLGAVKRAVDADSRAGQFVLTGSVRADLTGMGWPLTGRGVRLAMFGLTQRELVGRADRSPLFDRIADVGLRAFADPSEPASLQHYLGLMIRGGFPEAVRAASIGSARRWLESYADQIIFRDADLVDPRRDPIRLRRYLLALAASTAGSVDIATLTQVAGINRRTVQAYDALLENLLVTERVPAWWTNRIKRLTQLPKRYVIDSGLAAAILGIDADALLRDGVMRGRLADTFVVAQLRAEAQVGRSRPQLHHLRTEQGRQEVDLIAEFSDGSVFAFEVKAGAAPDLRDARHLIWLRDQLGPKYHGGVVLHTGPHTYRLADGVLAAPIASLWS